jgi:hypothetical protein
MANLFDVANAPEGEPSEIVVGDFIQWKKTALGGDYSPDLFTATYVARISAGGNTEIQLTGTANNGGYLFTVESETSEDFVPGYYHWQLEIVRNSDGNRLVAERGAFTAIVDLDINGSDPRTHDEIMLTKIQSLLEGRADGDVASYSIQGRSLTKLPLSDLIEWERYYRDRVRRQKQLEDIKLGRKTSNTVKVRF